MHLSTVLGVLGQLLTVFGLTMLAPLLIALGYRTPDGGMHEVQAFAWAAAITTGSGLFLRVQFNTDMDRFGGRESIAVVSVGWILFSVFGAIPWTLLGHGMHGQPLALPWVDAIFETMSGLTTCGSSILDNIEQYGHGVLFWRAMTHWMGGMGIVVMVVAILPGLGVGGYQLLRAEVPGPSADKIAPRIAQTARILWFVYVLLTAVENLLLWAPRWFADAATLQGPAGRQYMTLYEATCHAFATLATGGFSTRNLSLGAFGAWHQYVAIVFMFLAGTNFLLHWQLLTGRPSRFWKNPEWRFYSMMIVAATAVVFVSLTVSTPPDSANQAGGATPASAASAASADGLDARPDAQPARTWYADAEQRFRHSLFQVMSVVTCTGFATSDFDQWPDLCRLLLLMLMVTGGCAGSTAGGLKLIRVMVVLRHLRGIFVRINHPHAVTPVRLGGSTVPADVMSAIFGVFTLYLATLVVSSLILTSYNGVDILTATSASATCLGGVGPGLSKVGAGTNFHWMADGAKLHCCFVMLLGRLEFFTLLALLMPTTWRR